MHSSLIQIVPTPRDKKGSSIIRVYDPFDTLLIQQEFAGKVSIDGAPAQAEEEPDRGKVASKMELVDDVYIITAPWGERKRTKSADNQIRIMLGQRKECYFWCTWGDELDLFGEATERDWDNDVKKFSTSSTDVGRELSGIGDALFRILGLLHELSDSEEGAAMLANCGVSPEDAVILERTASSYKEAAVNPTPVG